MGIYFSDGWTWYMTLTSYDTTNSLVCPIIIVPHKVNAMKNSLCSGPPD